jgi:hypothetical protein
MRMQMRISVRCENFWQFASMRMRIPNRIAFWNSHSHFKAQFCIFSYNIYRFCLFFFNSLAFCNGYIPFFIIIPTVQWCFQLFSSFFSNKLEKFMDVWFHIVEKSQTCECELMCECNANANRRQLICANAMRMRIQIRTTSPGLQNIESNWAV